MKLKKKEWKLITKRNEKVMKQSDEKTSALVSKSVNVFVYVRLCVCVCVCVCVPHSEELGEYMESKGAPPPGILTLTTSLSKPFTRLERFPMLLKELDRHMEVILNLSVFFVFYLTCTDTYQ